MDKRLVPAILLIGLIAIIYFVGLGVQSRGNFAYVTIAASETLKVELIRNDVPNRQACERVAAAFSALMIGNCPSCKITTSKCLETPPAERRVLFDEAPVPYPSARMPGGVIAFSSANAEEALHACNLSAAARPGPDMKPLVSCFAPGAPRPLSVEASRRLRETQLAFASLGAAGVVAMLCLFGYLVLRTHKRRDSSTAATRLAENPAVTLAKFDPWPANIALAATDLIVLVAIFLAVSWPVAIRPWGSVENEANVLTLHLVLVFATVAWFWVAGEHYSVRRPLWDELREIARVIGTMFLISGAVTFAAGFESSRPGYLSIWLLNLLVVPLGRFAARSLLDIAGFWSMPTVVIGFGKNAEEAVKVLHEEGSMGYALIAQVWTTGSGGQRAAVPIDPVRLPLLETSVEELLATLKRLGSPQVVIALDSLANPESYRLVQMLSANARNINIVPSIRGLPLFGTRLSHFFSHDILFLTVRNNLARRSSQWIKRVFDVCGSITLLVTLAPLLAYIAWKIKREDGGNAIFIQSRIGKGGREFDFMKFRSMVNDADSVLASWREQNPQLAEEYQRNNFKLKDDPRVTKCGLWLRSYSLDELPQMWNILRGDMSFVGPRPLLERELPFYGEDQFAHYKQVTPGLTGVWQISGRSETTFADRASLDSWYVQNWSFWYDMGILIATFEVVLTRKGAY